MATEDAELFYKLVKAGATQATKHGAIKSGLPDDMARFLASQLSFTFDLVKKGSNLTPGYLAVLLAQKGLNIAGLAAGAKFDCAITVVLLGTSLTKAIALTAFTGPAHLVITAAELLSECYSVDKACGISDAAFKQVEKVSLPAYIWLDRGIVEWMSRGGI